MSHRQREEGEKERGRDRESRTAIAKIRHTLPTATIVKRCLSRFSKEDAKTNKANAIVGITAGIVGA